MAEMLSVCYRHWHVGKCIAVLSLIALLVNVLVYHSSSNNYQRALKPLIGSEDTTDIRVNLRIPLTSLQSPGQLMSSGQAAYLMSLQRILTNITAEIRDNSLALPILNNILKSLKVAEDNVFKKKPLPECPEKPSELIGNVAANQTAVLPSKLKQRFPELEDGGHFTPTDCKALQKLAIVIPYRNRYDHLHKLLNNLIPILMRQKLDFRIFVIEQDLPTTFNRGMLFNVGYLEALKIDDFDCFIFHDVDMIPLSDHCFYRCNTTTPRHMLAGVSKWKYGLPYYGYYGGVVAFTREQFKRINGDSNLYFGWGGEDDDLRLRVVRKGYKLVRYPKAIGLYDTISHKRDSGNQANPDRLKLVNTAGKRQDQEGLNTTRYEVTLMEEKHLYTWIHVFINMTEVLKTTPPEMMDDVKILLKHSQKIS